MGVIADYHFKLVYFLILYAHLIQHNNSTSYSFLGILVTNASIRSLLIDLKEDYENVTYIMTRKVNSDVVENLFSYLKGMVGSNSHISPLEFKYWFKH